MGVSFRVMQFLTYCCKYSGEEYRKALQNNNISFENTMMLGRACFYALTTGSESKDRRSKKDIGRFLKKHLPPDVYNETDFFEKLDKARAANFPDERYAEPFFQLLGAGIVDSLDYSDYEEATVLHDLCVPVPEELKNKYSCVFDGGVLGSIYEFTTALRNAMQMVAPGGHLILTTPGNNYFGHSFYQFSPELFYSILREHNGFCNTSVYTYNPSNNDWYCCVNPRDAQTRCELSPKWPKVQLCVISQRIGSIPEKITALQSDYENLWQIKQPDRKKRKPRLLKTIYGMIPGKIRAYVHYRRSFKKYFKKIESWK